jgi:outer membrane protein, multidrug efflux system
MRLRSTVALAALTGACSLVHPVVVTPPPAPGAFQASVDLSSGPPQPPGAAQPTAPEQPPAARPDGLQPAQPPSAQPPSAQPPSAQPPAAPPSGTPLERLTESPVWWSAFADPALDAAIQECFRNNLILRDVRGLIYENQLDPNLPQGWWYPLQVGILNPAGLKHVIAVVPPSPAAHFQYDIANAEVGVSYQVDLFGALDAQRRAGLNFAEQQRQLTEARVQDLAVRITQVWFDILEARALRELTLTQIKYNRELLGLIQARFEQHLTPRLVVLQQEQLLLNLESQVPLVKTRIALLNSELKALLGRMPTPADDLVPLERQLPDLPPAPALGKPADLVVNTPELRLAELRVAEVGHRINANRASWLPTLQLVGSFGGSTLGTSEPLLDQGAFGVTLTWKWFDGKLFTESLVLPMQLERRKLQYDLALRTAIGRVQDAVVQEDNEVTSLRSLRAQAELGRHLLAEARRLFEQGQSDYLTVLTALTSLVELERASLQAQRVLLNHRAEVYRSLGGTWSHDVTLKRE